MRPDRFTNRVCVVTGGASGIGAAAARGFAAEGGKVVLLDRNEDELRAMEKQIPGAMGFVLDVSSASAIKKVFEEIQKQFKAIHVLVNSAGVIGKSTLQNLPEDEWDRVLDINLKGTALCTQAEIGRAHV